MLPKKLYSRAPWKYAPLDGTVVALSKFDPIETRGEFTRGTSVVDRLNVWKKPANVHVCLKADARRFKQMLLTLLETGRTGIQPA